MLVSAGFDKISEVVSTGNIVYTAGLANCIAIVAYNKAEDRMAIAHYNTLHCFNSETNKFDSARLNKFRDWMKDIVRANAYAIGIGRIWYNTAPDKKAKSYSSTDNMRFDLIVKIKASFNHEPTVVGSCIAFGFVDGHPRMKGHLEEPSGIDGWEKNGSDIPYDKFA
jgi:hypothetical protein